jgi:hypothetical protein
MSRRALTVLAGPGGSWLALIEPSELCRALAILITFQRVPIGPDELCYALAILTAFQRILTGPDELCRL